MDEFFVPDGHWVNVSKVEVKHFRPGPQLTHQVCFMGKMMTLPICPNVLVFTYNRKMWNNNEIQENILK